jgi:hypothetical protein
MVEERSILMRFKAILVLIHSRSGESVCIEDKPSPASLSSPFDNDNSK